MTPKQNLQNKYHGGITKKIVKPRKDFKLGNNSIRRFYFGQENAVDFTQNKYRIGKSRCYVPNCRICGLTKKYLQDKARHKLLLNILPKNSASYLRNLAVPNYTISLVPEILTQKKDYIILVKIYDLLIRHVKEKHSGYVLLAGDFTTHIEKYTKDFFYIDFFKFSSFKREILMTCIPDLFENVAEQLRQQGYEAFVYTSETF